MTVFLGSVVRFFPLTPHPLLHRHGCNQYICFLRVDVASCMRSCLLGSAPNPLPFVACCAILFYQSSESWASVGESLGNGCSSRIMTWRSEQSVVPNSIFLGPLVSLVGSVQWTGPPLPTQIPHGVWLLCLTLPLCLL